MKEYKIYFNGKEFPASEYQAKIFDCVEHGAGNMIISAAAGSSKCLGRDTEILMYDGTIKRVQDIAVGDLLMGDDSKPRKVLTTGKNYGKLVRIIPKKGEPWVCNDVHILTLAKYRRGWKTRPSEFITVDIPVDELIERHQTPSRTHKDGDFRNFKLLKTGVNFKHTDVDFDPWLYGIWIGDGTTGQSMISNVDQEIFDEIEKVKPKGYKIHIVKYGNKCPLVKILSESGKKNTNKFRQFIRKESANNDGKYINRSYLINDKDIRLKLLAGIIDSDGHYDNGYYTITTKYKQLCEDILFLARSLGFGAYAKSRICACTNTNAKNNYYQISIIGDIDKIPVVLSRNKANKRKINKNPLHVGFKIEENGLGEYYGFTLDGNGRFLLSDFTITHNTTTIVNCTRFIPDDKRVIFIAFNKSVVNKLKEEVKRDNIYISTFHSLGYSILRENKIYGDVNEYKYQTFIKEHINDFTETKSLGRERQTYINNIIKLSEYSRYYLAFNIREIKKVAKIYGIIPIRDEFTICEKVLKWGKENTDFIDYTDMIWLPNVLNLTTKKYLADWIFVDEAQDTSIMEQEMVMKCFKRGTRFVSVGDDFQKINVWCGASQDAIDNLKKIPNTVEYKLPISYRCPNKVVELAKKYSDNIIAAPNAIDGEINYEVSEFAPKDNDMVLCRTTAPLIKLHLKYLRSNKKSYLRGFEEIKDDYLSLINECGSRTIDKNCISSDGLFPKMYKKLFKKIEIIKSTLNFNEDEAITHPEILKLYDDIEGIGAISDGLTKVDELIDKINVIFNGDRDNAVQLSTIHKAKGLESDNVYILMPSLLPYPLAVKDWEIETEKNLIYVAYTRAKKTLNFIKEPQNKCYRNESTFSLTAMKNKLSQIKEQIRYSEKIGTKEEYAENTIGFKINILGQKVGPTMSTTRSKTKKGGLKLHDLMEK